MNGKNTNKIYKILGALTICATFLLTALPTSAQDIETAANPYISLGTLDIHPVDQNGNDTNQWFIESLDRDETAQRYFRVSNFSNNTKQLALYATDLSKNENKNYFVKPPTEISDELAPWIQLATNSLTLQPGESKIISATFQTPKNAGVGLHQGAILARENRIDPTAPYQNIAVEKGIRVYFTVKGIAIEKSETTQLTKTESPEATLAKITVKNTGTVDLKQSYSLTQHDLYGTDTFTTQTKTRVTPETQKTVTLTAPKPKSGLYSTTIYIKDATTNRTFSQQHIGNTLYIPFWALALALGLALSASSVLAARKNKVCLTKKTVRSIKTELADQFQFTYQTLNRAFQNPLVQRAAIYTGLLAVTGLLIFNLSGIDSQEIKTQLIDQNNVCKYTLTLKWGNFRELNLPPNYRKEWQGRIYFPNARIDTMELLDIERSDKVEITGNKTSINFTAVTGPDNDGVIITLIPLNDSPLIAKYTNYKSDIEYEFDIAKYFNNPGILPDGKYATYIEAGLCEDESRQEKYIAQADLPGETVAEIMSSAEIQATPELQNLFTEDLPPTRKELSDVILDSDYVSRVSEENKTKKIEASEVLLKTLSATPEILAEISATPDLNYIFLPSGSITFPPLTFSFNETKSTAKEIGTMIFIQNKNTEWNTYIRTTDFTSLSSDAVIPASYIELDPGEPELLGSFIVKEGIEKPEDEPIEVPIEEPVEPEEEPTEEPIVRENNSINAGSYFNGKDATIEITDTELITLDKDITMSAWVYLKNSGDFKIVEKGNGIGISHDKKLGFQTNIYLDDMENHVITWTKGKAGPKKWYHVAATFDGDTLRLYVDGKEEGFLTAQGKILDIGHPVTIGSRDGIENFFSGQIDEVMIWEKVLSKEEIIASMFQSSVEIISAQQDLFAYWPLNEIEGETTYDKSPNKYHGTAFNITWMETAPMTDTTPTMTETLPVEPTPEDKSLLTPLDPDSTATPAESAEPSDSNGTEKTTTSDTVDNNETTPADTNPTDPSTTEPEPTVEVPTEPEPATEPAPEPTETSSEAPASSPAETPTAAPTETLAQSIPTIFNFPIFPFITTAIAQDLPPVIDPATDPTATPPDTTAPADPAPNPQFAAIINEAVVMDSATFQSLITSGNTHKFKNEFDTASLIIADPTPGKKIIFLLRPTIRVEIPPNTQPGTYQGALTITSL